MEAHFSVVKILTREEKDGPRMKLGFIDLSHLANRSSFVSRGDDLRSVDRIAGLWSCCGRTRWGNALARQKLAGDDDGAWWLRGRSPDLVEEESRYGSSDLVGLLPHGG